MVKERPRGQPLTNLMQLLILFYYVTSHSSNESITVEPQNNKPLYNEVPGIMNETSLKRGSNVLKFVNSVDV